MTYTVAGSREGYRREPDARLGRWARAEKVKLMPLCPYAKSVFEKTPDYRDVLVP
jgi:hypothetical protein